MSAHPSTASLIVEVADSSLRLDRRFKDGLYARASVPEYWIVSLVDHVLEVHRAPEPAADAAHGWRRGSPSRTDTDAERTGNMPKIWRVYSGRDGQSHIVEEPFAMKPFTDVEGAHGEGTAMQSTAGIAFRVSPPGYVLSWHCAPRRQYSISLSGTAEIEVGDGTVVRLKAGDVVLAEDLTGQGHITRVVGDHPRFYAIVPLAEA